MRLLVCAGPNGSGKSSLRDSDRDGDSSDLVIDPDQIARPLNPRNPRASDVAAGRQALAMFRACLAAHRSMSLETILAGHSAVRRLKAAKQAGYTVDLRCIALDYVAVNIQRVRARVAGGGHYVSPVDIKRRYAGSHLNLPEALDIVDRAILTDRTVTDPPFWLKRLPPRLRATFSDIARP